MVVSCYRGMPIPVWSISFCLGLQCALLPLQDASSSGSTGGIRLHADAIRGNEARPVHGPPGRCHRQRRLLLPHARTGRCSWRDSCCATDRAPRRTAAGHHRRASHAPGRTPAACACSRGWPTVQVQAEVTRHDTLGREIGQAHVVQDPHGPHEPALDFLQRNRALLVRQPLVLVKHRLHQRRGQVAAGRARRRSAPGRRSDWCRCGHSTAGCPDRRRGSHAGAVHPHRSRTRAVRGSWRSCLNAPGRPAR